MPFLDIQHEILDTFVSGATAFRPVVRTTYGFDSASGFGYRLQKPAFAATIVVDLSLGNYVQIIATANTNITISAPINVPAIIAFPLIIEVNNQSGGAMGTVTLNAAYKSPATAAFSTQPASTKNQVAGWQNTGTQATPNWHQWFIQSADSSN
jgi:hypothetical protein